MTSTVELEGQLVDHLTSVLASAIHGSHTRRLFTGGALLHSIVNKLSEGILRVALKNVVIDGIVCEELFVGLDGVDGDNWQLAGLVGDDTLETVEENLSFVEVVSGVQDLVGSNGSIIEAWRLTSDLVSGEKDFLSVNFLQSSLGLVSDTNDLVFDIGWLGLENVLSFLKALRNFRTKHQTLDDR